MSGTLEHTQYVHVDVQFLKLFTILLPILEQIDQSTVRTCNTKIENVQSVIGKKTSELFGFQVLLGKTRKRSEKSATVRIRFEIV